MTSSAERESVRVGQLEIRSLITADESHGTHTVIEVIVPPGAAVPVPHSHDAFEETFVGMAGQTTVVIDGREDILGVGEAACILRGQIHGFRNDGRETARFLGIAAPGVFGWPYFQEISEAFTASPSGPPNKAVLGEIMRRHGLTPAPPPAAA